MAESLPNGRSRCLALAQRRRRLRVVAVAGDDGLSRRLIDHGMWPGAEVELVATALGGDPMLFLLHGYRLALRREEAQRVMVEDHDDASGMVA